MPFWIALAALVGVGVVASSPLAAQDDWAISRDPEPRRERPRTGRPRTASTPSTAAEDGVGARMIERYLDLVVARPEDDAAVRRLLERASARPSGVDAVVAALEARREREGTPIVLALAAIALERGRDERARELLDSARASDPRSHTPYVLEARRLLRGGGADAAARAAEALAQALERAPDASAREAIRRDLAGVLLDLGRVEEARVLYDELGRGGSVLARTELVRELAARGLCAEARPHFDAALRAAGADASATVGLALLRSRCEASLGASDAAREALSEAWSPAARAGRSSELLDAMVALARETDGLAALEVELSRRGGAASLHRGIVLEELGREEEALEVLREVLARSPRDAETRQRVARLLARNGRIAESLDERRTLARLFPERIALSLELATALRDQGQPGEALGVLDRARARARSDRTALFLLVDAYARAGARDRVLATLEAIVRASPDDPRALVALANELLDSRDRGDRERALALVSRVASRGDVSGHLEAARALANLRHFDQALVHLDAAASIAPDAPEVLDAQADLYERAGRDEDAERALLRRITVAAESQDPGDRESALDAESRLVASWHRRGRLAQHLPDLVARHAAGDASAGRMLADAQRRTHDLDGALATLLELARRAPDDARIVASLARLHHERGDYDAEVASLLRLADLEPTRAGWHLSRLVELALASYRDDDAIRFATQASQRAVDDAGLLLRIGRLHARRRDTESAARAYVRALGLDPDEHEAAWELATIERERGNGRRAIELQLAILERSRDDELRERAGRALLETARADGSEAALEPRLLSLALAHGDAPVFRRLALALYASLGNASRARGDTVEVERWVARALPVLLGALRDTDLGSRASARHLLLAHPVPGAAPALLSLAADPTVEAVARVDAAAAALRVVGPSDRAALRALATDPAEPVAVLGLHGLVRLLSSSPRDRVERARALLAGRARGGLVSEHAWALTLLVASEGELPGEGPPTPWLVGWYTARRLPSVPTLLDVLPATASRTRGSELTTRVALELAASGRLDDRALDQLAQRAASSRDAVGRAARGALPTRASLALSCAPVMERREPLVAWLNRAIDACPRAPREAAPLSLALARAAQSLPEASVPAALALASDLAPTLPPEAALAFARSLVARVVPVESASVPVATALLGLVAVVPALDAESWRALLARPEREIRERAVAAAPLPELASELAARVSDDESWTARRGAILRLAGSEPGTLDASMLEAAAVRGLADPVAFVRSAALELAAQRLTPARSCELAREAEGDPDPLVAQRARSLGSDRCTR